ncbi:MAG: hypothetical protein E5Y18_00655 [Mesorhizobium sp.]|nr:MAG: hypothetical protein E5Y18_00655 [Mesorhizobium sp.]
MAGIASTTTDWAEGIAAELQRKLPGQRKTQRGNLALLVATMLNVRSANLVELASGLPLAAERTDMRYQWIARFLANDRVDCDAVMQPFAIEILANLARDGRKITLIMDQTKDSDRHRILMLSVGFGERALPLAWRVEETDGAIGFATQKALLEAVVGWLPQDVVVTLMADRFYGTPSLIGWLADHRWGYRLRLKGNLTVRLGAAKTTTGDLALSGDTYFADVRFTAKRVRTHIGSSRTRATASHGSSPCRTSPIISTPWTIRSAGASSRCFRIPSPAASASRRPRSSTPAALPASPRHGPRHLLGRVRRHRRRRRKPGSRRKKLP